MDPITLTEQQAKDWVDKVVYSSDGKDLSIDGAQVGDQFIDIDFFTAQVRGDWYRAIRAEERLASASDKAAAAASWSDA